MNQKIIGEVMARNEAKDYWRSDC